MSCDACPRSRPTVRPACGRCPDIVVVPDNPACLPTIAAPASGRTALYRKGVAAAGTEAGDRGDVKAFGRRCQPSTSLYIE